MLSAVQQQLLSAINEHSLPFTQYWQDLYTQLYTLKGKKIQEFISTLLEDAGMSIHFLTDDRSLFYGERQVGAAQTLLLYMQVPTVSSPTTLSYLTTALVAYRSALSICVEVLGSLPINIKWLFDARDPTVGQDDRSTDSAYVHLLHADQGIWYVPELKGPGTGRTPALALGTKGTLNVELTVQTADAPVEASYGSIVPDAAWQLLWALNTLKDQREDILIEGFYDAVLPVEDEVISALAELARHAPALPESLGLQRAPLGLEDWQQYYAYFLTPTCTVTSIQSGQHMQNRKAYIPQVASAQLDFQLVPWQDPDDIYTRLQQQVLKHGALQTRLLHAVRPIYTSLSNPFVQSVLQATQVAYSQSPSILPLIVPEAPPCILHTLALPCVIIPSPTNTMKLTEGDSKEYMEPLIQHIKQETLIIASIAWTR